MTHGLEHPRAGKTVVLTKGPDAGDRFDVIDWWDRIQKDGDWREMRSPVELAYVSRVLDLGLPKDRDVVYGKVDGRGLIVHDSELGGEVGTCR